MKLSIILPTLTILATTFGASTSDTLPQVHKFDPWGFISLDKDGILRSWAINGTVLDAIPYDSEEIATFINMREGLVDPQQTINDKASFANVNGYDVPASQYYDPPTSVQPTDQLVAAHEIYNQNDGVLPPGPNVTTASLFRRDCVPAYCASTLGCWIYHGCFVCIGLVCLVG